MDVCRDSYGVFANLSVFNIWTCSLCYVYLFPNGPLRFNYNVSNPGLIKVENIISGNIHIETTSDVCESLGGYDCERWRDCCQAADTCCTRQRSISPDSRLGHCPRTWDGWSCFDDTSPGKCVRLSCPSYVQYGSLKGHVEKECTENGSWALHPETGKEWTDYSKCVNIKGFKGVVYASVGASVFSLVFLLPATLILMAYRQLRSQQRIRLHVCLFMSFILTGLLSLLWELLVYNDRVENPWKQTFMFRKEVSCKVIYILLRYATSANFFWMFCEGFYLFRLLVHAFQVPRSIKQYFVIGWVGPALPIAIYSTFRSIYANDICWVKNAGGFEWIVYTPNLLSILVNLLFLLGILRILLSQLHQHPNEPSNYRQGFKRALKATFVLIPLFGLQLFLVIYRPSNDSAFGNMYEIVSKVIIDSQGGIIALVFCYMNKEVLSCLKTSIHKLNTRRGKRVPSLITNYTVVSQRNNDNEAKCDVTNGDRSPNVSIALKSMRTNWNGAS
ncbi:calcitonin gene-related peptide type 1 receptor-like [Mya arenaria]|uniref:calcitonin gene-related peptide type 1 receptor-like n=1 Tax=Mya arenaria TaxID=6604 RepID=UPI0022E91CF4|nr:calcitonin gene-related peptide type 1 receptor-like [Mya arenaria]